MARYNLIQINETYLTSNGLAGGRPCKVQVTGLEKFVTTRTGQVQNSANGTPYAQVVDFGHKGLPVEFITDFMAVSVFDTLVGYFEDAKNDETVLEIVVEGDTGDYAFDAIPFIPGDITFTGFSNGIIKGATFRVMST